MGKERKCAICGNVHDRYGGYCKLCYNGYQRWRRQNPESTNPLQDYRNLIEAGMEYGYTAEDTVPARKQGRPKTEVVDPLAPVYDENNHPPLCGCWQCSGYDSYEAWVADGAANIPH